MVTELVSMRKKAIRYVIAIRIGVSSQGLNSTYVHVVPFKFVSPFSKFDHDLFDRWQ